MDAVAGGVALSLVMLIIGKIVASYFSSIPKRLQKIEEELHDLKESLPQKYVLKEDYKKDLEDIKIELRNLRKELVSAIARLEEKITK